MAKAPADRPWDAAAVGVELTELRDKAERGGRSPWSGPPPSRPGQTRPRAGVRLRGRPTAARNHENRARCRPARPRRSPTDADRPPARVPWLEPRRARDRALAWPWSRSADSSATGSGPPAQDYLYQQAEALMASTRRTDWMTARDEYLDPLDQRFPEQSLSRADPEMARQDPARGGRKPGQVLTSPVKTSSANRPTNAERQFVIANSVAAEASRPRR